MGNETKLKYLELIENKKGFENLAKLSSHQLERVMGYIEGMVAANSSKEAATA